MAGLYIHIPFCHSKCAYCDFYSTPNLAQRQRLVNAIAKEWAMRKNEIEAEPVRTIYLGGGTPSILPITDLQRIIQELPREGIEEFTIEVNPEDVSLEKANGWRALGINRVSMGVQSFVDEELKIIGRRHSAAEAILAAETLRKAGFDNISMDLIYGLPQQTRQSWAHSVDKMIALNPEHISAYSLTYEPRTRLSAMLKRGDIREASEEDTISYYEDLCAKLAVEGYSHYEISNFARPGKEAKHNSSYWRNTPYLGLGPSAHSFDGYLRRINPANLKAYLESIEDGKAACEIEPEDADNRFNDQLITALRTAAGLDLSIIAEKRKRQLLRDAAPYLKTSDLLIEGNHLRMTEKSWLISDAILTALVQI